MTAEVTAFGSDDWFGFAIGFNAGDASNAAADYLLIDWKKAPQGAAAEGLAVSRVRGSAAANLPDMVAHTGIVEELERGALGTIGWQEFTEYRFEIKFTASSLQVVVNGVEAFNFLAADVGDGTDFDGGNFAFYNFAQPDVRYGVQSISEPGVLAVVVVGLIGLGAVRHRKRALPSFL